MTLTIPMPLDTQFFVMIGGVLLLWWLIKVNKDATAFAWVAILFIPNVHWNPVVLLAYVAFIIASFKPMKNVKNETVRIWALQFLTAALMALMVYRAYSPYSDQTAFLIILVTAWFLRKIKGFDRFWLAYWMLLLAPTSSWDSGKDIALNMCVIAIVLLYSFGPILRKEREFEIENVCYIAIGMLLTSGFMKIPQPVGFLLILLGWVLYLSTFVKGYKHRFGITRFDESWILGSILAVAGCVAVWSYPGSSLLANFAMGSVAILALFLALYNFRRWQDAGL